MHFELIEAQAWILLGRCKEPDAPGSLIQKVDFRSEICPPKGAFLHIPKIENSIQFNFSAKIGTRAV